MQTVEQHPELLKAIAFFGSQPKLVAAIDRCVSQQTISRMLNGESRLTGELAVAIHKATSGAVPKWKLRPDLFEEPSSASHDAVSVEVA